MLAVSSCPSLFAALMMVAVLLVCVAWLLQNTGTSLLECFTFDEIRTHLESIAEAAEKTKTPAQMPLNPGDECKVCNLTKLTFEPPCIYCTQCGQRIKRGQIYHCTLLEPGCDFRGFWCHSCLQEHKGDKIPWEGSQVGSAASWSDLY
jgi:E1A/CREB-binding protein